MSVGSVLTPWLALAAVLVPLVYIERWLHSHLYGVGWLISRGNPGTATALYYLILFPGVFVHEFTQYLIAGALNVRIKKVVAWPEAQNDGTLRLDFVRIQKARWYQAAIIGAAPLLVGTGLVWLISNHVLKLTELLDALGTGDITLMGAAVERLASTPDFYIWLYLIFAISNAMFPTPADRQGWPLLVGIFVGLVVVLLMLGVEPDVLLSWYEDHVAAGLEIMTTAFAAVLVVAFFNVVLIGFMEEVLEYTTRRKFDYGRSKPRAGAAPRSQYRGREPGSAAPLPFDVPLPSIYNQELPVPDPAKRTEMPARKPTAQGVPGASLSPASSIARPQQPASPQQPLRTPVTSPDSPRPVSETREPRPALTSSARPAPEAQSARRDEPSPGRTSGYPTPGTVSPQRAGRPYDPDTTLSGDIESTQRLTPSPRPLQAPASRGMDQARAPSRPLSPYGSSRGEEEELIDDDEFEEVEEIEDEFDDSEDDDIQLVDFDDI